MKRIVNLLMLTVTIVVNALANALPINNQLTGQISDRFQTYFTPAGYVFSIWGLIYLMLIGFAVYQLLPSQRNNKLLDRISFPFWLSCVANACWIMLWHYEYFATTFAVMLVLLASLIWLTRQLFAAGPAESRAERVFLRATFSLYLGWVSVATIANLCVVLEEGNLRPFNIGAMGWAVGMVIAGGLVTLAVGLIRKDLVYLAVIVWAFVGICVRQEWAGPVALAAGVFAAAAVILATRIVLRRESPQTAR